MLRRLKLKLMWLVRTIGVLAFLVVAVAAWMGARRDFLPRKFQIKNTPYGLQGRVLAMGFVETPDQVNSILDQNDPKDPNNLHNCKIMRKDMGHDFLWITSTVSCGGYIGSWLTAWIHRQPWGWGCHE